MAAKDRLVCIALRLEDALRLLDWAFLAEEPKPGSQAGRTGCGLDAVSTTGCCTRGLIRGLGVLGDARGKRILL